MNDWITRLDAWMRSAEDEHLEFKEAKASFHFETLVDYCAALANERGGKIILGMTDRPPRRVVGSQAFPELGRTKAGLTERLHLRIEAWEIAHPDGRVVVFDVPSRPIGVPIAYRGAYKMRSGESLVDMTPDMLRRIFEESGPDFSQEICAQATFADLAPEAIRRLRELWHRRSGNDHLLTVSDEQLLMDAELINGERITYAALILLGTHRALGRHLGQAEVIFEYRSSDASLPAGDRQEYREGFLGYLDGLWDRINLRNDRQPFQLGLVRYEIQTFNERAVREVLLNAVSHRDYRRPESVFVRQYPRRLEVVSPGGFLNGISPDNVLWRQAPRNRRIAEVLQKCGLVERAGQGMNRIFEEQIKESKPRPDFSGTDDYQVSVTLHGEIQDERFLRFIERIGSERVTAFSTEDLLLVDLVHREQPIPEELRPRLPSLISEGIVEASGRGRGVQYMLSRRFYDFMRERGSYTRRRGLDRETNKALLLKHIEDNQAEGSPLEELRQVLPALSEGQIKVLLRLLRSEGSIHARGRTRAGRWFPGPGTERLSVQMDQGSNTSQSGPKV